MSNRTSKSITTNHGSKITSFFKPQERTMSSGTSANAISSSLRLADKNHPGGNAIEDSSKSSKSHTSSLNGQASVNNSFSDASIPSGSQPKSSQGRVVPSSDGEESSEDSDGLEDPQKMFNRRRRKNSAADPAPAVKKKTLHPKSPAPAVVIPKAMPPPSYKFSLDNLVTQKTRSDALDQEILRSRALFEEASKDIDSNGGPSDKPISEDMLEDALGEGTAKRLMAALHRKDAWRIDKSWHFYDIDKNHKPSRKNLFPSQVLGSGWDVGLASVRSRQQLFLSGFVQDIARVGFLLPEEVYVWMLDELCLEVREDLAYAYLGTLRILPGPMIQKLVTESRVSRMFSLLGGRDDALDIEKQIVLVKAERIDDKEGCFYNTKLVASLFGEIAKMISSNSALLRTTFVLLVRLALDVRVSREAELRSSIEETLARFFEEIPEERWLEISQEIGTTLISTISDAPYRLRVLNTLPIHTPRTHLFRRRLALTYSFDDPSYLTQSYTNLVRISRFSNLVLTPQFEINKHTDYSDLQSLVSIMDIAIDDGPTAGDSGENDAEVDVLVEDIRTIFSGIHDTNAQNLARTEAKDTLERLMFRLRFAVRARDKMNLVVETGSGPEWVGRDGKIQSKLPWIGKGGGANGI